MKNKLKRQGRNYTSCFNYNGNNSYNLSCNFDYSINKWKFYWFSNACIAKLCTGTGV